jgi:Spy/CpxP family protein refolding chaperone
MTPWTQRGLIALVGATVLFGGIAAYAQHRPHDWAMSEAEAGPMRARMLERVRSELALDTAQQAKLVVLADTMQQQRQALAGGAATPRAAIGQLVAGPQFDRSAAQAWIDGKTAAMQAGAPTVIAAAADFYDSLRVDQQAKVREFLARRGGHFGRG